MVTKQLFTSQRWSPVDWKMWRGINSVVWCLGLNISAFLIPKRSTILHKGMSDYLNTVKNDKPPFWSATLLKTVPFWFGKFNPQEVFHHRAAIFGRKIKLWYVKQDNKTQNLSPIDNNLISLNEIIIDTYWPKWITITKRHRIPQCTSWFFNFSISQPILENNFPTWNWFWRYPIVYGSCDFYCLWLFIQLICNTEAEF